MNSHWGNSEQPPPPNPGNNYDSNRPQHSQRPNYSQHQQPNYSQQQPNFSQQQQEPNYSQPQQHQNYSGGYSQSNPANKANFHQGMPVNHQGGPPPYGGRGPPPVSHTPPSRDDSGGNPSIFVGGLPSFYDDAQLGQEFERYGAIVACHVQRDTQGLSRGFGVVTFADAASARRTLETEVCFSKTLRECFFTNNEKLGHRLPKRFVAQILLSIIAAPPGVGWHIFFSFLFIYYM